MRTELARYARQMLGSAQVVADRSWGHGVAGVLEVRDGAGVTWFVKGHADPERYRRELAAYRRWVPGLGGQAPELRAYDDDRRVLLLSAVPGEAGLSHVADPEVHRAAGKLLRRLHGTEALPPWTDLAARKLDELDRLSVRGGGLFEPRELDFVRAGLRDLSGVPAPPRVPCHLDYGPRNWLVARAGRHRADGRLHVIDFEWAGPEVWVNDLNRLYFGPWRGRPDLADAFLAGYGRTLDDADRAVLHACGALTALFVAVWAQGRGDPGFAEAWRQNLRRLMDGWR
ncbi:aminoglycoside phosphotransferase family protein [Plantactinospora veratri]|uniref:Aminoglycoside phosphotransferase family protein n=1 Tax=Plantactinospora veratri TaxID=1436122 RepID=A0ABU7SEL0_9ACTN